MTFSYLKIVRVMSRCDLYASCSKLFIYISICYYRDFSSYQWEDQCLTDQILISLILRIYGNCGIA